MQQIPIRISSLSVRHHALLATLHPREHQDALERGDWTCCDCGIRMPDWMEVHAANGDHQDLSPGNLRPICHYCHLVHHAIAATRMDSIQPVWWPELAQAGVNRLAWAMMAVDEMARQNRHPRHQQLLDMLRDLDLRISQRRDIAARICGTARADVMIESLHEIRLVAGPERMRQIIAERLADIRFWPRRRVRIWSAQGVADVTSEVRRSFFEPGGMLHAMSAEAIDAMAAGLRARHQEDWQALIQSGTEVPVHD